MDLAGNKLYHSSQVGAFLGYLRYQYKVLSFIKLFSAYLVYLLLIFLIFAD